MCGQDNDRFAWLVGRLELANCSGRLIPVFMHLFCEPEDLTCCMKLLATSIHVTEQANWFDYKDLSSWIEGM